MAVKSCEKNPKQSDCQWSGDNEADTGQMDMSLIHLDGPDPTSPFLDSLLPLRKVAVSEILPLTLVGNQVSLAAAPTNSALPLSPIFIKTNGVNNNNNTVTAEDKSINICEYYNGNPAGLLENLEEITSLPNEFLNIGELYLGLELSSAGSDLNSFHLSPI